LGAGGGGLLPNPFPAFARNKADVDGDDKILLPGTTTENAAAPPVIATRQLDGTTQPNRTIISMYFLFELEEKTNRCGSSKFLTRPCHY
jgi:hypothetical protein